MLDKRKQGEEAMRILKAKGISFNEKHNDNGDNKILGEEIVMSKGWLWIISDDM